MDMSNIATPEKLSELDCCYVRPVEGLRYMLLTSALGVHYMHALSVTKGMHIADQDGTTSHAPKQSNVLKIALQQPGRSETPAAHTFSFITVYLALECMSQPVCLQTLTASMLDCFCRQSKPSLAAPCRGG